MLCKKMKNWSGPWGFGLYTEINEPLPANYKLNSEFMKANINKMQYFKLRLYDSDFTNLRLTAL